MSGASNGLARLSPPMPTDRVRKAMGLMRHLLEYGSLGADDRYDVRTAVGGLAVALRELARQRLRDEHTQSKEKRDARN